MKCEWCAAADITTSDGVELESSRTMYPFDGEAGSPSDPNRPIALCRNHAAEHHAHWDEMWAEVRAGWL